MAATAMENCIEIGPHFSKGLWNILAAVKAEEKVFLDSCPSKLGIGTWKWNVEFDGWETQADFGSLEADLNMFVFFQKRKWFQCPYTWLHIKFDLYITYEFYMLFIYCRDFYSAFHYNYFQDS